LYYKTVFLRDIAQAGMKKTSYSGCAAKPSGINASDDVSISSGMKQPHEPDSIEYPAKDRWGHVGSIREHQRDIYVPFAASRHNRIFIMAIGSMAKLNRIRKNG
jgi:hypothetical protein